VGADPTVEPRGRIPCLPASRAFPSHVCAFRRAP